MFESLSLIQSFMRMGGRTSLRSRLKQEITRRRPNTHSPTLHCVWIRSESLRDAATSASASVRSTTIIGPPPRGGSLRTNMSSSPSSTFATHHGFTAQPVDRLAAHLDGINLGLSHGFREDSGNNNNRTTYGGTAGQNKPLPATPINQRVFSNSSIPLSLQPGNGRFAQGYRPMPSSTNPYLAPIPTPQSMPLIPPTMSMPVPSVPSAATDQSLTMTYARSAPPIISDFWIPPQPQPENDGAISHHHSHSSSSSASIPTVVKPPSINTRIRASSSPPSPASATGSPSSSSTVQCAGTTKAGKKCTRVIKAPPPLSLFAPTSSEPIPRYCFQHTKEILAQSGFYSRRQGGGWVKFADWIPEYLHADTQAALRVEMEKPIASADEPGYIYAYEIRDDTAPNEIRIKVGRAVKLVKRLDQWSKQCTSKEVILRGWWPGRVEDDKENNGTSLLRGTVIAGEKGPFCHRLERLIHLELADLSVHAPYLVKGFPNTTTKDKDTKDNGSASPGRPSKVTKVRMPGGQPCKDCGAIHKEIFTFMRAPKGSFKDMEWERLVKPVIERWGGFARDHA